MKKKYANFCTTRKGNIPTLVMIENTRLDIVVGTLLLKKQL